ncbi:MAG: hypothetical protein IPH37_15535 [Burkholderiales bacterium]|nr:hypothetical protein [Burkholderiales bacterium]
MSNTSFKIGHYGIGHSETLTGTASDDVIDGKGGGDQINGGTGNDTVLFFDSKNNFTITTLSGVTT